MQSGVAATCYRYIKCMAPIGIVFALGVILRIILFWQDKVIAADGISYVNISRAIFRGDGFAASVHFPPFYPILIGLFSFITPYDEVAGKVVSTIMGSLVVIPIYLLGKELFSKKVGFIAALFAAFSPTFIAISGIVLSQSTYITVFMTALYLFWKSFQANSKKMALIAGLMFAVSYLTRPEAVIVFVGVTTVFLIFSLFSPDKKDSYRLILLAWSAFFIIAFPYILLLHEVNGTWQLTGKSSVTLADSLGWYLNRPDLKREPGFSGLTYLDIIKNYPNFLWKNPLKNLPMAWAELQTIFWLFAFLGLVAAMFSHEQWRRILYLGAGLLPAGVIIVFFWIDSHYFSPCLPILYILAGAGLESLDKGVKWMCARLGAVRYGELAPWGLMVGIVIAIFNSVLPVIAENRTVPYDYSQDGARYDHKLIGQMLKNHLPAGVKVMTKSGRICFYGEFQQVDIPQASLAEILQVAKVANARYLIVDGTLFDARPQLEPFFAPLFIPQEQFFGAGTFEHLPSFVGGLKLVLLYKDPASVGVAVYKF